MRTNPFYDAWLFLTGSTGEHEASGIAGALARDRVVLSRSVIT
jgi:hypothetical protein